MRINDTFRAAAVPALLLAAAAAGPAQAAGADFQYLGQDDRPHAITDPRGCVAAAGKGGGLTGAVVNHTGRTATLYPEPGCKGRALLVVGPHSSAPVGPFFSSVRFTE
ncbi:hypothetical protein [Streptomyces antimicrobicus]|uniref:Secreted protein n=1 Tax=Streptomyces antimicrobicus TaxID=2883108 RepID=A0ABS8B7B7_9ACTN|nr:hypothetical protein [Streptomyces antimicrobicus]MCB5180451.1 hypothetical protein [Streptomyces antimicrobicus]